MVRSEHQKDREQRVRAQWRVKRVQRQQAPWRHFHEPKTVRGGWKEMQFRMMQADATDLCGNDQKR